MGQLICASVQLAVGQLSLVILHRDMRRRLLGMALEQLLMGQSWKKLGQIADARPFGFEQVFAFTYKWDILHRWLFYDGEKARERFEELISEVTIDHQNLFA